MLKSKYENELTWTVVEDLGCRKCHNLVSIISEKLNFTLFSFSFCRGTQTQGGGWHLNFAALFLFVNGVRFFLFFSKPRLKSSGCQVSSTSNDWDMIELL